MAAASPRSSKRPKPAEHPVEQPTKLELLIELKTAKALCLTIRQSVLVRADDICDGTNDPAVSFLLTNTSS